MNATLMSMDMMNTSFEHLVSACIIAPRPAQQLWIERAHAEGVNGSERRARCDAALRIAAAPKLAS